VIKNKQYKCDNYNIIECTKIEKIKEKGKNGNKIKILRITCISREMKLRNMNKNTIESEKWS